MRRTAAGSAPARQADELINKVQAAPTARCWWPADYRIRVLQEAVFASDAGRLHAAMHGLEPGYARLDYGALVAGTAGWGTAPGEHLVVHLITDLQQSASPLRFADLAAAARRSASSWWMWRRRARRTCASPVSRRGPARSEARCASASKAMRRRWPDARWCVEVNGKQSRAARAEGRASLVSGERVRAGQAGAGRASPGGAAGACR